LPDPGGEVVRECLDEVERLRNALLTIDGLNKKLEAAIKKRAFDDFHSLSIKNIFELRRVIRTLELMKENLKGTTSDYIECA
jgi:hypothetical protein